MAIVEEGRKGGPDRVRLELAVKFLISTITNSLRPYSNSFTASAVALCTGSDTFEYNLIQLVFSRAPHILLCPTLAVVSTQILQSHTLLNCHLFVFH